MAGSAAAEDHPKRAEISYYPRTFVASDGTELLYECHGAGRRVYAVCGGPADDFRYLADDLAPLEGECELVFHDYRGSDRDAMAVCGAGLFGRHLSDVRIEVLDDIGHDPFFEAPNASFEAVRSFLNA